MATRQTLTYNQTGQVLEFYPREIEFGPLASAPTVAVYTEGTGDDGDAEFSGTATSDSVSTTFDAASGYSQTSNRNRCNLTATTGIVAGRKYLATDILGRVEEVGPVLAISSGAYVEQAGALAYDYVAADAFEGWRQYYSVPDAFIQDSSNIDAGFRVVWTYSVNSITRTAVTYFDVVRAQATHGVTSERLFNRFPDWRSLEFADGRGLRFRPMLDEAEHMVREDLLNAGVALENVRESLDQHILEAWILVIADTGVSPGGRDPELFIQQQQERYNSIMRKLISRVKVAGADTGGVTKEGFATIKLTR